MACLELDSSHYFSNHQKFDEPFDLQLEDSISAEIFTVSEVSTSTQSQLDNIPKPPPLPGESSGRNNKCSKMSGIYSICASEEIRNSWDKLFNEGYGADVHVVADDNTVISAHSCVLGISSPVLRNMVEQAGVKDGFKCIEIRGVPSDAARLFVRYIYSSCFEEEGMKKYVLHLLVLSHSYSVPSLKRVCINQLEKSFLTTENVVDVLQLARECDAPRLSLMCTRLIIDDFKIVSATEGWKAMKQANPRLEQELLETLVEADSTKVERAKKIEERNVYVQLYEAMEAIVHICRDGCRTIGPRDKSLAGDSQTAACGFTACKGIESLVRHFSGCGARVPGGCANCKRMWQLLELHSRMCNESQTCQVPLCRHFKEKMQHLSKKEELKWDHLVSKVKASKGTLSSICYRKL